MLQVNISAAHFGKFDVEQRGIELEIRFRHFAQFDWSVRFRDYGYDWHVGRRYCIKPPCLKVDIEKYKKPASVPEFRIQLSRPHRLRFRRARAIFASAQSSF